MSNSELIIPLSYSLLYHSQREGDLRDSNFASQQHSGIHRCGQQGQWNLDGALANR